MTQSFRTSDLALKHSLMFGAKGGYFFTEEKLPWLGVELEAFASKPSIKTQTLTTEHIFTIQPNTPDTATNCNLVIQPNANLCPKFRRTTGTLAIQESDLRVIAVAFNVIARYPGKVFQPYAGAGAGAFYFWSPSGSVQGRQVVPGLNLLAGVKLLITEEWGLFAEGKYNRATISNLDQSLGLSAEYSAFNFVAGVAFHF